MVTQQQLVKTRPIILRPHEVRGILDGTVTQLWRAMEAGQYARSYHPYEGYQDDDGWPMACSVVSGRLTRVECPYGEAGARLWGREGWRVEARQIHRDRLTYMLDYAADPGSPTLTHTEHPDAARFADGKSRWRSSATMPRWASRIMLEIESVSALAVQDVTIGDMRACGLLWEEGYGPAAFADFWNRDNPRHPWKRNPMAWRLIVRRVEA